MRKIDKIGVQLWTVRDYMNTEEQIRDTFHKIKNLGYDQVQTAGCPIPYDVFGALAADSDLGKIKIVKCMRNLCKKQMR